MIKRGPEAGSDNEDKDVDEQRHQHKRKKACSNSPSDLSNGDNWDQSKSAAFVWEKENVQSEGHSRYWNLKLAEKMNILQQYDIKSKKISPQKPQRTHLLPTIPSLTLGSCFA